MSLRLLILITLISLACSVQARLVTSLTPVAPPLADETTLYHKVEFFADQNKIWYTYFTLACQISGTTIQPLIQEPKNIQRWSWYQYTIQTRVKEIAQQLDKLQVIVTVHMKGQRNQFDSRILGENEISTWGPTETAPIADSLEVMFEFLYGSYPELLKVKKFHTLPAKFNTNGEFFPAACSEDHIDKKIYAYDLPQKSGTMRCSKGDTWGPLQPFSEIFIGDTIKSGSLPFRLYFKDKGMVRLLPNTTLAIQERAENFKQFLGIKIIKGNVEVSSLKYPGLIVIK